MTGLIVALIFALVGVPVFGIVINVILSLGSGEKGYKGARASGYAYRHVSTKKA